MTDVEQDDYAESVEDCRCDHVPGVNCCGVCECITNTVRPSTQPEGRYEPNFQPSQDEDDMLDPENPEDTGQEPVEGRHEPK